MFIRCWGSRGSIPVSGKEYFKYGGDTTCIEVRTRSGDIIVVDAGTGIRRLGNALLEEGCHKVHFLLTHAHWDHLMGFAFFKLLFVDHAEIHMHRGPFHLQFMRKIISKILAPPNFPLRYADIKAKMIYNNGGAEQFEIGSVTVIPIPISHPNAGKGYKFIEDGKSFVFLTDNELGFIHPGGLALPGYLEFCRGVDLLIHDAEFTPAEYGKSIQWGHSTYVDALKLAFEADAQQLGLFHHNQERSDDAVDAILADCRRIIADRKSRLECVAVSAGMDFTL